MIYTPKNKYTNIIFNEMILEALTSPSDENVEYIKNIATKTATVNPIKYTEENEI